MCWMFILIFRKRCRLPLTWPEPNFHFKHHNWIRLENENAVTSNTIENLGWILGSFVRDTCQVIVHFRMLNFSRSHEEKDFKEIAKFSFVSETDEPDNCVNCDHMWINKDTHSKLSNLLWDLSTTMHVKSADLSLFIAPELTQCVSSKSSANVRLFKR